MDEMQQCKLIPRDAVLRGMAKLSRMHKAADRRHRETVRHIDDLRRQLQMRCSHDETYEPSGQYMRCETWCAICGTQLD